MYCTYDYFFRILCSLAKVDEAAQWEDVTNTVSVRSRTKGLQFETKVSAAFWLLVCRDAAAPAAVLRTAEIMYRHVARRHPYVARLSVFYRVVQLDLILEMLSLHVIFVGCKSNYLISGIKSCLTTNCRKHAPFAWCDCVKVYCAVNNQVETFIEQRRKLGNFCYKEVA